MDKPIRFTHHARQKLVDLAELGFAVTETHVIRAVRDPDHLVTDTDPPVAQKAISNQHVIRVVFVEDEHEIRIVTSCPARRGHYEPDDAV